MKTFEQFMSQAADDKDPYWGLFEINKVANQAVLNAVEYGYKKAEEEATTEITRLNKMVFDLQNSAIEMAGKLKQMEGNPQIIDDITIMDEHEFNQEELQRMAENITYDRIENNLIEVCNFVTVLYKVTETPVGKKYDYLAIRTQL
jgi:hypothetical protein